MKVGIINFHFAHNYGAVLESSALQMVLEQMGHEVEVINYRPDYMVQQHVPYPNPIKYGQWAWNDFADKNFVYRMYRVLRRLLQALYRYKNANIRKARMDAFEPFINRMNQSRSYKNIRELRNDPPKCDAYICGSDQIWNPYVTSGKLDEAYFLQFGSDEIKRISYAASPCQLDVKKHAQQLKDFLSRFQAISLRESEKQAELSSVANTTVSVCSDPTMMLQANEYSSIEKRPAQLPQDYILVYGFEDRSNPNLLGDFCRYIGEKTKLPIIDISLDLLNLGNKMEKRNAATPGEFLYYIKHASYVVTNSFHGTVFSILYEKNLFCLEKKATGSRMRELMVNAGLGDRLFMSLEEKQVDALIDNKPNYDVARDFLKNRRDESLQFLRSSLE